MHCPVECLTFSSFPLLIIEKEYYLIKYSLLFSKDDDVKYTRYTLNLIYSQTQSKFIRD